MANPSSSPESFLPLTPLALDILLALADGPLHGYGIVKDIEERAGRRTGLRSGTLYTALHRLKEDGLIEDADAVDPGEDARRKHYALAELGRSVARAELARLDALVEAGRSRRLIVPPTEAVS